MSSRRSRNGGRSISTVFSRNSRSWRKRVRRRSIAGRHVGRGDDADVDRHRHVGADRGDLALLERGQQFGLEVERQIADLVEEQVPPSAACIRPIRSARASVKAPFTWPNSSESNSSAEIAPRSTDTISRRRGATAVKLARDQFLAGAVLAEDQDVGVGRRRPARSATGRAPSLAHRRSAALRARRGAAIASPPRSVAASARAAQRSGGAHGREQPLVRPRLRHEIGRAALHRLDRDVDPGMRGDHHHDRLGIAREHTRRASGNPSRASVAPRPKLASSRMTSGSFASTAAIASLGRRHSDRLRGTGPRSSSRAASRMSSIVVDDDAKIMVRCPHCPLSYSRCAKPDNQFPCQCRGGRAPPFGARWDEKWRISAAQALARLVLGRGRGVNPLARRQMIAKVRDSRLRASPIAAIGVADARRVQVSIV